MSRQLERFPDDGISRVLCVVAHPDDMEYGASAAVAHWTRSGIEVSYLLLTHGEAGMQRAPHEARAVRSEEQRKACEAVGVGSLTMLEYSDGVLQPTLELRRDIARVVRQRRPDAVLVTTWSDEAPWGLNQADHRVAGLTCVDAVAAAGNRWIFPELVEEGLEPWQAQWLLISGSGDPTHGVIVEEADVAAAVASLECHRAYLADLPDHPKAADFIPPMLTGGGGAMGVEHAAVFRAHSLS